MLQNELIIDYYQGSEGPTVIIVSKSEESIAMFRDVVHRLVSGELAEIDFAGSDRVKLLGFTSFMLKADKKKNKTFDQSIWIKRDKNKSSYSALWVKSPERWQDTLDFVDVLVKSGGAGHQYLQEPFYEDAVIEFSYKEGGVGPRKDETQQGDNE